MIFGKRALAVMGVFGMLALGGCGSSGGADSSSAEVRYRVTVEVDTPQGVRSGSSVWSTKISKPTLALASPYDSKFSGESVTVDLPNGKTLFALLQETIFSRQFRELHREQHPQDRVAHYAAIAASKGESVQIPCEKRTGDERGTDRVAFRFDCLALVSFADLAQPTSVFKVDYHDAAASLGKGYAIKRMMVEITDAPVTVGIRKRFLKLGITETQGFDQTRGVLPPNPTLAQKIGFNDFVRGLN